MAAADPTDIALSFVASINAHDTDALDRALSDDHVFVDPLGHRIGGRARMREAWGRYLAWFPDYGITIELALEQNGVVALFGSARGTYAAQSDPRPEDHWEVPAAWLAVIRDGLVAEWHVYADEEPARRAMGAANRRGHGPAPRPAAGG